ncbi:MAG: hypothetical protein WAU88_07170, partial [Candidatus Zixiibacteriota bacterium]
MRQRRNHTAGILSFVLLAVLAATVLAKRPIKPPKGDIVLPVAVPLRFIPSGYPLLAGRECKSADVAMEVRLTFNGNPFEVKLISCSCPGYGFEDSAQAVILRSHFLPLTYYTNPVEAEWAKITLSYRCYNGLTALYGEPSGDDRSDSIPRPPETLLESFKSDHIEPRGMIFFPFDSAAPRVAEGDVYLVYKCTQLGQVTEAHPVFSTLTDTALNQTALRLISEGSVIFSPMPWTRMLDSHLVRVSFRNHRRSAADGAVIDTFVPITVYPEMISQAKPDFPRSARNQKFSGTTWVEALVDTMGVVKVATIWQSSG